MGTRLKALLVEDNPVDAELLVLELSRGGYEVVFERVDTPEPFRQALERGGWDIVFSDHAMPQFSSQGALDIFRQQEIDIPFIIISGTIGEDAAVEALKAGASDYLMKGNLARLVPAVKRELQEVKVRSNSRTYEEQLQAVFNSTLDVMLIVDDEGRYLDVNPAACQILGMPREELLTRSISDLFYPNNHEQFEAAWHDFLTQGKQTGEISLTRPDGAVLQLDFSATARILGNKHLAVLRDITERKHAFERERLLRRIVEIINQTFDLSAILSQVSIELGKTLQVDRAFIIRYKESGDSLNISVHGEYYASPDIPVINLDDFPPRLYKLLTENLPLEQAMHPYRFSTPAEYHENLKARMQELLHLTQEERDEYAGLFKKILIDKQCTHAFLRTPIEYRGNPYGVITLQQCKARHWSDDEVELLKDISTHIGVAFYQTDLYQQEQNAAERESIVRKIVEAVHDPGTLDDKFQKMSNALGHYLKADHVFISRYDSESREICPPTREYRASKDIPSLLEGIEILKDSGWMFEEICRSRKPYPFDQNTPNLSMHAKLYLEIQKAVSGLGCAINFNGECLAILFIHQCGYKRVWTEEEKGIIESVAKQGATAIYQADLYQQEQKARQDAEAANRKKSEFLSMMSHELRTPLNAIIGYSQMMERGIGGTLSEKHRHYVDNVLTGGRHLLEIVNDLLDVSKVEAGKMTLNIGHIELAPLIQEVRSITDEFADQKKVRVAFHVQPGLDGMTADPSRLKQIFVNLVNNAIKFNHENGEVNIWISKTDDNQWLVCDVQDTGIGIPTEKQAELFKEFYQVDTSYSRHHEGTGLGLALTRQLVELHGGTISVESEEGVGSTFSVRLPVIINSAN